ncbi:class I SAM-dependent methyltransferase [Maritimibacter sp. UBA3975]|uniref:class I SAM-dependent methyltransferase n=2 Tax=Maritimibacter TaxID=404235 RepID=UPI000C09340E|nr:methyltransferase type 11 [Maritimibacter sp.]
MHKETISLMKKAFAKHVAAREPGRVLDVGSVGKRRWFRGIWEEGGWTYDGMDLKAGPNVDVVLEDPWRFDIADGTYDAVISGNMLEHNEFFWLTFLEMSRVLKMGGVMVHVAPSRGPEHRDPQDCWRWYRDGMFAMAKWGGFECRETTTDWSDEHIEYYQQKNKARAKRLTRTRRHTDNFWGDTIGVFVKVTETADTMGMNYIRQFAARHPEKTEILAAE